MSRDVRRAFRVPGHTRDRNARKHTAANAPRTLQKMRDRLLLAGLVVRLCHRKWRSRRSGLYLVFLSLWLLLFAVTALFAFSHVGLLRCGLKYDPVTLDVRISEHTKLTRRIRRKIASAGDGFIGFPSASWTLRRTTLRCCAYRCARSFPRNPVRSSVM